MIRFASGSNFLGDLFLPELFNGRSTDHHRHIFGIRQHPQDILKGSKIVDPDRNNGVIGRERGKLNSALVHGREHHRGIGKELLPVPLDEGGRRRADAHNQVERMFGKKRTQILDERSFRVFIAGAGGHKRMVSDVQAPW